LTEKRYWQLDYTPKLKLSPLAATEGLTELLKESVRLRLISDVPLGAFLSGGLDSSAIVGLMSQEKARVKTFAIGFEDAEYDELRFARVVAKQFDTEHHELVVRPNATALLPRIAWHYGEPYADSSAVPTFYLAQFARQHITVALNGDGGDENFGGYTRYLANRAAAAYQRLPLATRRAIEIVSGLLPRGTSSKAVVHGVHRFLRGASQPQHVRYATWFDFLGSVPHLTDPDFDRSGHNTSAADLFESGFAHRSGLDPVEAAMAVDVETYLPDDLLVKIDIATMAHGLEARSPFLDHHVMEFVARLPSSLKVRGRGKKYILRRAMGNLLPDEILNRKKQGFGVPLDRWFRNELAEPVRDLLLGIQARHRGYFQIPTVERLIAEHQSGDAAHGHRLWALMMLELWHQTYFDVLEPAVHAER
jgi:asparagine synthase (glutamine-hydrolysing)